MKLFSWKQRQCKTCDDCKKQIMRLEKALAENVEVQVDIVTQLRKALEQVDARLKKLEVKKKPSAKKQRPQPVFKRKHN
jgi:BMFP domain-containing protein YqiC